MVLAGVVGLLALWWNILMFLALRNVATYGPVEAARQTRPLKLLLSVEMAASAAWAILLLAAALALLRNRPSTRTLFYAYARGKMLLAGVAIGAAVWATTSHDFPDSHWAALYLISSTLGMSHPALTLLAIWSNRRRAQ